MIPVVEIRVDHCWLKVIVIRPHSFLVSYLSVSTSVEPGFLEYIQTCKALCHGSDRNWGLNWDHQVQYLHILLLFAKVIQSVYVAYLHSYRHINLVYIIILCSHLCVIGNVINSSWETNRNTLLIIKKIHIDKWIIESYNNSIMIQIYGYFSVYEIYSSCSFLHT